MFENRLFDPVSVPPGLSDAERMYSRGSRQKRIATTPTTWRQPTSDHHRAPVTGVCCSSEALAMSELLQLSGPSETYVGDRADDQEDQDRQGACQAVLLEPALEGDGVHHRDQQVGVADDVRGAREVGATTGEHVDQREVVEVERERRDE